MNKSIIVSAYEDINSRGKIILLMIQQRQDFVLWMSIRAKCLMTLKDMGIRQPKKHTLDILTRTEIRVKIMNVLPKRNI